MKISTTKKITALFSALVLTVTGFNPAFSAFAGTDADSSAVDLTYTRFDIKPLVDAGVKLKNACSKEKNDEEVLSCYQKVLDLYQDFGSALVLSSIEKDSSGNSDEYLYESSINNDVMLAFSEALYYPFFESQYKKLFEENVSSYIRSFILSIHSEKSDIGSLDQSTRAELNQKYQELYQSFYKLHSISSEEFEMQSAQIYIDLVKNQKEKLCSLYPQAADCEEAFYQYYNRDYSGQDIENRKESIRKTSNFIFNYCVDTLMQTVSQYSENDMYSILYGYDSQNDYLSDVLLKYSSDISEEVYKSAKYMYDNTLLFKGTPYSTTGGYTSFLYNQNTPVVFVNGNTDRDTLRMVIHEFGHFNAFLNSDLSENFPNADGQNIDISEVQSQGMEVLFWNYYDDIYGDYSNLVKAYALYQFAETFITSFFVNEFESAVIDQIDTITPEEVIKLFHEMQSEYDVFGQLPTPFGSISSLILQPFYTISYSMSLLPVWELISITNEGRSEAVEKYTKISNVNALDPDSKFLKALSDSGFSDILNDEYINSIRKICADYADSIEGIINGDINKDGAISATDLMLLKKIFLQDIEPGSYNVKQADLNRDGKLTASDLVAMVLKLL